MEESEEAIIQRTMDEKRKRNSHTGNRTRIGRVRACYPNQLDYMGLAYNKCQSLPILCIIEPSFFPIRWHIELAPHLLFAYSD